MIGATPPGATAPGRAWTLRRRVTALCLLGATVLGFLAAGATTTAVANRGEIDRLLDSIGPMRTASTSLMAALVDQQNAIRGYVLRGSEEDLQPYSAGRLAEQENVALIAANSATTPQIRAELDRIIELADDWRADIAEPAIAAVRASDQVLAEEIMDDQARIRFDEIRAAVESMQRSMQEVRDASVISIKDTSTTLLFVLIVAAILVIASGTGLLIALQRAVIGPVTDLAAQVRTVAQGNYGTQIAAEGPPELANLASDVETMRQRIANDLAEVDAARRQIEEVNLRLEQQTAELFRSNRDLEQFAYVASHDLQEPLRKVASFCQLLQRRYQGQLDERADQYIAFAVNGAQRMQRLINDLLAFSRIGRTTTGFTDVDLARLVADEVVQLDSELDRTSTEVTWSNLPVVRGEESLLATLVSNLIGNSIKFRRPDTPARVHLSGHRNDTGWEITCQDNGIGIDPAYADKVFVIFQRLHSRDAYPGTGIGLAMAKKIVEYHGGDIWVDTDDGPGTTIRFTLPIGAEPVSLPSQSTESAGTVHPDAERTKEPVA